MPGLEQWQVHEQPGFDGCANRSGKSASRHGFSKSFLDFFACVNEETTCALAMQTRSRVVVGDVQAHPIFKGKRSGKAMLEANARAVQSTPLISASGEVLGVFSTHCDRPRTPDEHDLAVIDHIGDRTAYWLDKALDALNTAIEDRP